MRRCSTSCVILSVRVKEMAGRCIAAISDWNEPITTIYILGTILTSSCSFRALESSKF